MFVLKQFLKQLILPPLSWLFLLLAVLIFWRRRGARKLLVVTFCLIAILHLVTSAMHMPRSMLAFSARAPEPIPAPGDFSLRPFELTPLHLLPSLGAARAIADSLHEYIGLADYYWRIHISGD